MTLPADYAERVYAGILGKIIGVYLGRPFEGWSYERIMAELGEIRYYVNHRHDLPLRNHLLVVTDDDISGTFTFLRAMPDYGNSLQLKPAQIGQTWLNYIIEKRTTLWWGGLGNSTEHTAYLRLKSGIPAPHSGAISLNGKVVAEQIGAQIFIEGWGLIAPGDPALAADFARRAASVSHDGEAIYAAQVVASMVAQAFIESNINHLLDTALAIISEKSLIHRLEGEPINIPRIMLQSLDIVCIQTISKVKNKRVRRCKQIIEIIDIDPTTKEILTNEVFRWDPIKDEFQYSGKSFILDQIRMRKNMARDDILNELKQRAQVLQWMVTKRIHVFDEVASITANYLEKPKEILTRIHEES